MEYRQDSKKCWYEKVCSNQTQDCKKSCIRYAEMNYLIANSGIPESRQYPEDLISGNDYDSFVTLRDIKNDVLNFVKNGENLYITSEYTGNGKTSWAIKILLKYFDTVWAGNGFRVRGMFVHVPTLLLQLKDFNNPLPDEYKQNLLNADLIVWDEIANCDVSNYDYSNLLMFIDNRSLCKKANIFTGNRSAKEDLEKIVGAKLTSRIWNTSEIVVFQGKDRRDE